MVTQWLTSNGPFAANGHVVIIVVLGSKLRSGTSETKRHWPLKLSYCLYQISLCKTCSLVWPTLYHVTVSCKGSIDLWLIESFAPFLVIKKHFSKMENVFFRKMSVLFPCIGFLFEFSPLPICCKIALDKAQILNATLNTVNTMSDISQLACSRDVGRPTKT